MQVDCRSCDALHWYEGGEHHVTYEPFRKLATSDAHTLYAIDMPDCGNATMTVEHAQLQTRYEITGRNVRRFSDACCLS